MYGGPTLLVQTVEQLTDVPINHYAQVNLTRVSNVINAVGGVNVTLPETTKAFGHTFPAGVNHLDGRTAIYYARQSSLTEEGRVLRQQSLFRAVADRLANAHLLNNPIMLYRVIDGFSSSLTVDAAFTNSDVVKFANQFRLMNSRSGVFVTAPTYTAAGKLTSAHPWLVSSGRRSGRTRSRLSQRSTRPRSPRPRPTKSGHRHCLFPAYRQGPPVNDSDVTRKCPRSESFTGAGKLFNVIHCRPVAGAGARRARDCCGQVRGTACWIPGNGDSSPGLGSDAPPRSTEHGHADIRVGVMANGAGNSQPNGTWPEVRSGPLIVGGSLIGIGVAVAAVGLAVAGSHLVSATREWLNSLETPPSQFAQLKWEQAKTAAASGANTWREHPNAKARLTRRGPSAN